MIEFVIKLRESKKTTTNNWRQKIVSSNRIYTNLITRIHFDIYFI